MDEKVCRNCGGLGDYESHLTGYRFGQRAFDSDLICEWCFMAEADERHCREAAQSAKTDQREVVETIPDEVLDLIKDAGTDHIIN